MPKFLIVVDDTETIIRCRTIEAEDLEGAKLKAYASDWEKWDKLDELCQSIIREDLCERICGHCGSKYPLDQSCGCFDNGGQ